MTNELELEAFFNVITPLTVPESIPSYDVHVDLVLFRVLMADPVEFLFS